jgi:hypothetical protein
VAGQDELVEVQRVVLEDQIGALSPAVGRNQWNFARGAGNWGVGVDIDS